MDVRPVTPCFITPCFIYPCFITLCFINPCFITPCFINPCFITPCFINQCFITQSSRYFITCRSTVAHTIYAKPILIPAAPSPPPLHQIPWGLCGAFACLVSPGGGLFTNFELPGGRQTTSSPPFFLRDSRASETRARVKITPREKRRHLIFLSSRRVSPFLAWDDFHARSRFARSTIPEEKWGTTRGLGGRGFANPQGHS